MVSCGYVLCDSDWEDFDSNLEYTIQAIKEHRLGSVWMSNTKSFKYALEKIKENPEFKTSFINPLNLTFFHINQGQDVQILLFQ